MNRALVLTGSVAGAVVVALDGTVLMVAQPALRRDLDTSLAGAQWTGTAYLVAVAALLVVAGRFGDRHGHLRLYGVGMLGFGAVSAAIAAAPGVGWVIGLRVAQGVCGALLQPATLGMLRTAYPPEGLRRPIALRTAAIGLAVAVGPVMGGALTSAFGWRSVFLVNVVPAAVCGTVALAAARREPRRAPGVRAARPDLAGALWLAVALAALVHTLVEPSGAWALPGAALAVAAGAGFVRRERRAPDPLLPPAVRRSPGVPAALALLVTVSAALNGALFCAVFVLQDGWGLDPLGTALTALPLAVLLVAAAPVGAVTLRRAGARRTVAGAIGALVAGLLVLAVAAEGDPASGPAVFCVGFALLGAGFGAVMVAATHVVVRQVPAGSAGVAGGWQQTALNVGPVLGLAVATVLMGAGGDGRPLAGAAVPLVVLAAVTSAALPLCRVLPGRSRVLSPGAGSDGTAPVPAGRSDVEHTVTGGERGVRGASLGHDEV
ncbi:MULTISPECIES: MFS transporter [unclassified Streptomyces]|uniref:MFS transporter n=1 Tax=unclassified Streptomyces TaxID=2593676 RepID=UPI00381E05CB